MSQAAVFNTCQIPFRSGFPATVRRGVEAAGLAPGVCGAAGVSANQRIKSTETAPVTNFESFVICRLFDPNGWLILPTDAAGVKPLGSTPTRTQGSRVGLGSALHKKSEAACLSSI